MRYFDSKQTGIVVTLLEPGDLLLECLIEVARKMDIHTGAVLTGIGSMTCEILTLAEFSILRIPDLKLHGRQMPERSPYHYRMLDQQGT